MLRFLKKTAEASLQPGIDIGFGKETFGKLPRPIAFPRGQCRSHGTSSSESTLGIGCGQKLGDFLLEERDF
jgi:hypothetical protein